MTQKPAAIHASDAPPKAKATNYPEPFASRMAGRLKRPLGDLFGDEVSGHAVLLGSAVIVVLTTRAEVAVGVDSEYLVAPVARPVHRHRPVPGALRVEEHAHPAIDGAWAAPQPRER